MDNKFYIKEGSFCFIIPFFTEGSDVCDNFFKTLQDEWKDIDTKFEGKERKEKKDNATERVKQAFVSELKNVNFPHIQTNFSSKFCIEGKSKRYARKHLCNCVSCAAKFHDDISQKNNSTQIYLDQYKAYYKHTSEEQEQEVRCNFVFNVLLYLNHVSEEKVGYMVIEMNMKDIEGNFFVDTTPKDTLDPEYIIFIKHLFYKQKMILELERQKIGTDDTANSKKRVTSLQNWVTDYLRKLCVSLGISYVSAVPDYAKGAAFRYSFIELKEIRNKFGYTLYFDFDQMDDFLKDYCQFTYGLLLSDEGWRATPAHIIQNKLKDFWFTRKFCCMFFLQHNAILFNQKNSSEGNTYSEFGKKWFDRYQDNKYSSYISAVPCLTGIDTLAIFAFLKAIFKEIQLDKYIETMSKDENETSFIKEALRPILNYSILFIQKINNKSYKGKVTERIKQARKELSQLSRLLNSPAFMLGEIKGMEKCIYNQFGIFDTIDYVKELYLRQADKLHFSYEINNNITIKLLTIFTVVIGLMQMINPPIWRFWLVVIFVTLALFLYFGDKYEWSFKKIKKRREEKIKEKEKAMSTNWIDKEVIYQIFVDRFSGKWKEKENGNHFMGGNLRGVINKLDYLRDLGITTIWLSPVCCTQNYHGYHTTNFMEIDPRFGTIDDLTELIDKVHAKKMKIIVDFVPNHCSIEHPFFKDALKNENSNYRDWFYFDDNNNYKYFLKYEELAKINLDNPIARKYMINVARFWCANGFDGLRIDHAIGPSFDFWHEFMLTMRQEFPDKIFFGEIWSYGIESKYFNTLHLKNKFLKRLFGINQEKFQQDYIGVLDGVLDFAYRDLLIEAIEKGERILNNKTLENKVKQHFKRYPADFKLLLFLDNHDTNRFLYHCKGDTSLLLEAIQFSRQWNKAFILFYGTEQSMMNHKDIFDDEPYADLRVRECMDWSEKNTNSIINEIKQSL